MKIGIWIGAMLLMCAAASAATIHGTVYDLSLEEADDVVVEIDTTPMQRMVAKDGKYLFEVGPGEYSISAVQKQYNITSATTEETVTIVHEGDYVLDLFLFPVFDEDELVPDIEPLPEVSEKTDTLLFVIIVLLALVIVLLLVLYAKRRSPEQAMLRQDDEIDQVIAIIRQQGGRTTQKEIRRHMPVSEAKVSLILSELESKGIVEKIKKGRGNIIILKR